MQGFGLPRHVVRNGCVASRLRAQSPGTEAPRRDGPVLASGDCGWPDRQDRRTGRGLIYLLEFGH